MYEDLPWPDLLARLRAGDEQAAAHVFHRFAHRLAGLARTRLGAALRAKEDPEDVTQSAFKSFFRRCAEGQYKLESWDGLWGLLTRITLHKCGHRLDRFYAARRDVRREAPAPDLADSDSGWEPVARDPTPSQAALAAEVVEQLHQRLAERDRRILRLRLEGEEIPEISLRVGCTERTVFRVLERIRQYLRSRCADDAQTP